MSRQKPLPWFYYTVDQSGRPWAARAAEDPRQSISKTRPRVLAAFKIDKRHLTLPETDLRLLYPLPHGAIHA